MDQVYGSRHGGSFDLLGSELSYSWGHVGCSAELFLEHGEQRAFRMASKLNMLPDPPEQSWAQRRFKARAFICAGTKTDWTWSETLSVCYCVLIVACKVK